MSEYLYYVAGISTIGLGGVGYLASKCYNAYFDQGAAADCRSAPDVESETSLASNRDMKKELFAAVHELNAFNRQQNNMLSVDLQRARSMISEIQNKYSIGPLNEDATRKLSKAKDDAKRNKILSRRGSKVSQKSSSSTASWDANISEDETVERAACPQTTRRVRTRSKDTSLPRDETAEAAACTKPTRRARTHSKDTNLSGDETAEAAACAKTTRRARTHSKDTSLSEDETAEAAACPQTTIRARTRSKSTRRAPTEISTVGSSCYEDAESRSSNCTSTDAEAETKAEAEVEAKAEAEVEAKAEAEAEVEVESSSEAESSPTDVDPLVGKAKLESGAKVMEWLNASPAAKKTAKCPQANQPQDKVEETFWSRDPFKRNDKHMRSPDVVSAPPKALPATPKKIHPSSVSRDTSAERTESQRNLARKSAPHLFKRLVLRKKSSVTTAVKAGSKSRQTSRTDLAETNAASENVAPQADEGNQKSAASTETVEENVLGQNTTTDLPEKPEKEESLREDPNNKETEGSHASHDVSVPEKSKHEGSTSASDGSDKKADSSADSSARNKSPAEGVSRRRKSLSPNPTSKQPSPARLLQKIDQVLGLKSTSFDKRKPFKAKGALKDTIEQMSRSLSAADAAIAGTLRKTDSLFDKLDANHDDKPPKVSTSSQDKLAEKEGSSSNTDTCAEGKEVQANAPQMDQDGHKSAKKKAESAKVNPSERVKENQAKGKVKDIVSHQSRPKAAQKESVFVQASSFEKRKEFQAKYHMKNIIPNQVRPKSAGSDEESSKTNTFERRKEFQAKYHMRGNNTIPNQGGPKLTGGEYECTKANPFEKRKEFQAKYHMKNIVPNQGRSKSAGSKDASPFEKRKEFDAKFHIVPNHGRSKSAGNQGRSESAESDNCSPFESSNEFEDTHHTSDNTSERDTRPMSAESEDSSPFENSMDFEAKHQTEDNTSKEGTGSILAESDDSRPSESTKEIEAKHQTRHTTSKRGTRRPMSAESDDSSPFENRHEFQVKHHTRDTSSKRGTRSTSTEKKKAFDRSQSFDLRKAYQPKLVKKGMSLIEPETSDIPTRPRTRERDEVSKHKPGPPRLNRLPTDTSRKTIVFDWDSRQYAVEDNLEDPEGMKGTPAIARPKGKRLPKPREMKRPLASGRKVHRDQEKGPTTIPKPTREKPTVVDNVDETAGREECAYVSRETAGEESFSDLGFETVGGDFSCSYGEALEQTLNFCTVDPAYRMVYSEDEDDSIDAIDALLDEYIFPKCASDMLPNERNTRVNPQGNFNSPQSFPVLGSRSEVEFLPDDGDGSSNDVFIVVSDPHRMKRTRSSGSCMRKSSEVIEVLTQGYRQLAREETLRANPNHFAHP